MSDPHLGGRLTILLLGVAFCVACDRSGPDERAADLAAPALVLSDSPLVSIGGRDERKDYLLSYVVGARRLSDGRIVIADHQPRLLRYYDSLGVHLRSASGAGEGPGEFGRINSIAVGAADTVIAWDAYLRRLSLFSPEGGYASTAALEGLSQALRNVQARSPNHIVLPGTVHRLDDGGVVVRLLAEPHFPGAPPNGVLQDTLPLISIASSGGQGSPIAASPGVEFYFHDGSGLALPFGQRRLTAAGGNVVYLASTVSPVVEVVHAATGDTVASFRLPVERHTATSEDIELTRRRLVDGASENSKARMAALANAIPFPDSLPLLSDLLRGRGAASLGAAVPAARRSRAAVAGVLTRG